MSTDDLSKAAPSAGAPEPTLTSPPQTAAEDEAKVQKLQLEIAKLEQETSGMRAESELKVEKLRLEVKELQRPHWLRPTTTVPLLLLVASTMGGWYSGYFDVKRNELQMEVLKKEQAEAKKTTESAKAEAQGWAASAATAARDGAAAQKALVDASAKVADLSASAVRLQTEVGKAQADLKTATSTLASAYPELRFGVIALFKSSASRDCLFRIRSGHVSLPQRDVHQCLLAAWKGSHLSYLNAADAESLQKPVEVLGAKLEQMRQRADQTMKSPNNSMSDVELDAFLGFNLAAGPAYVAYALRKSGLVRTTSPEQDERIRLTVLAQGFDIRARALLNDFPVLPED
jgi:hypothetical protein